MDWSEGYVTDIGYTRGYYRELSCLAQVSTLALTGYEPPPLTRPFTKIELGCGYGLTLLAEAAVYPHAQFYGIDFNPNHITWAKRLAADAQLDNVHFLELSFADLTAADLPEAEFVGLHGVWSWISAANREAIVEFLARRLKNGGVAMVSFNVLPGWSPMRNVRELMMLKHRSVSGPIESRIDESIKFAQDALGLGLPIGAQTPKIVEDLKAVAAKPKRYLAHEYFNQDWHIFYQYQVAQDLERARLAFAASCRPAENLDNFNFSPAAVAMIGQVAPGMRETFKDFVSNRTFRYDLFVRGIERAMHIGTAEHVLDATYVLLDKSPIMENGAFKMLGGALKIKANVYTAMIARLEAGPATGRELLMQEGQRPLTPQQFAEVLAMLTDAKALTAALGPAGLEARVPRTRRLNDGILRRSLRGEDVGFLISPLTGLGHMVAEVHQFFIAGLAMNVNPIDYAWSVLDAQGRRLKRDGAVLETTDDNLKEMAARYETFEKTVRPLLTQLKILT